MCVCVCVCGQSRRWWSSVHSTTSTRYKTAGVAAISSRLPVRWPDRVPVTLDTTCSSLSARPFILPTAASCVEVRVKRASYNIKVHSSTLSPVYSIQPVVKPVVKPVWQPDWQPAVSCIQPVVKPVVQPGLTTGWTNSGCSFNTVVKPVVQPVWPVEQPVWQPAVSCKRGLTITTNWRLFVLCYIISVYQRGFGHFMYFTVVFCLYAKL